MEGFTARLYRAAQQPSLHNRQSTYVKGFSKNLTIGRYGERFYKDWRLCGVTICAKMFGNG